MWKRQLRLVAAFHTTDAAIRTERLCREAGLEGRLITVPRSVTSDCGLAWSAAPEQRERLTALLAEYGVETAGLYDLEL